MNILITGITGFVGSHLADYITTNHPRHRVYGLVRWRSPLDNIQHLVDEKKVTLIQGDLLDLPSLDRAIRIIQPERVFHLAAQSYVPYSYTSSISTLQTNVVGSANLFSAIRNMSTLPQIHVCSSSEVYGQPEYTPIDEFHPTNPISPYGVSKLSMDRLAFSEYKAHNLPVVITRAFTHTGPRRGDCFVVAAFAKQIVEIELGLRDILYVGNLESIRTFCDVRDMVRAYYEGLGACDPGQIYNVGGHETMSIKDMLDMMIGMTDSKIVVRTSPLLLRPADVTLQIPDTSKFTDRTGWQPLIPFTFTLIDMLTFYRRKLG